MIDTKVPIKTDINRLVLYSPSIGLNDSVSLLHYPSEDALQVRFESVWNIFLGNTDPSYEKVKKDSLFTNSFVSLDSDSFCVKLGIIGFNFIGKWRLSYIKIKYSKPNFLKDLIGTSHRQSPHLRVVNSGEIKEIRRTSCRNLTQLILDLFYYLFSPTISISKLIPRICSHPNSRVI